MKPRRAADTVENRLRTVSIVMVLCLLMLIGILVAVNTGKGKKGRLTAQTSTPTTTSQPSSSTSTASVESVQVPPLTIYRRRNIFKPLVDMDAGQNVPATGGGTAGGAATVITLPPELDATGSAAGSVVSTAVTLDSVFQEGDSSMARIRVGDQLYDKVAIGDVFGNNYKLLAIGKDSSATILYGDERFSIFAGQSLYL
jgi:hypothetical protein